MDNNDIQLFFLQNQRILHILFSKINLILCLFNIFIYFWETIRNFSEIKISGK